MVFFTDTWKPSSFYDRVKENVAIGLHTLILLDIKVKEPNLDMLARGKVVFEPPRFMTVAQCARQMVEVEDDRGEGAYTAKSLAVGAARVGAKDQRFVVGTLEQLVEVDLGGPLHSVVLLGKRTHDLEREYLRAFAVDDAVFDQVWEENYKGNG